LSPGQAMTLDDLKPAIRQLLIALDFLHSECQIVHTGNTARPSATRIPGTEASQFGLLG
jgi:hypothetical protein